MKFLIPITKGLKISPNLFSESCVTSKLLSTTTTTDIDDVKFSGKKKFRVLSLSRDTQTTKRRRRNTQNVTTKIPREKLQSVNQDWTAVWPGPRSFHPGTVPLPVFMGMPAYEKTSNAPDKWGNLELMKIPNFLHLTPAAIEQQCKAIKKFCTAWPKELENEEVQDRFFPLRVTTSSFLHSAPTIRDPRSRLVTIHLNIDSLKMDDHSLDKFLRMIKERFDADSRVVTLAADRCPLRCQNKDYLHYLLTVLYEEAKKVEPWEASKGVHDYESFSFGRSESANRFLGTMRGAGHEPEAEVVQQYKEATEKLHNEGEDEESTEQYKKVVEKLLNL